MRRWSTAALGLMAVLALSAGCARGNELPDPLPSDVPYAYHLQTTSGSDGALLEGTLELQDGCLVVMPAYEGMNEPVVPVLPIAVTSWDGDTLTVNGTATGVGEGISLGGGYHAQAHDSAFVPAACPTGGDDRYFIVGLP